MRDGKNKKNKMSNVIETLKKMLSKLLHDLVV